MSLSHACTIEWSGYNAKQGTVPNAKVLRNDNIHFLTTLFVIGLSIHKVATSNN